MRLDFEARKYLGVPFLHQGRDACVGIDCIGLAALAGTDGGYLFVRHDATTYARHPADGVLESYLDAALPRVPLESLTPGDIVAIAYAGAIRHLGVIGEQGGRLTLIHTSSTVGRVTEHGIDAKWARRIKRAYRPEHPNVG